MTEEQWLNSGDAYEMLRFVSRCRAHDPDRRLMLFSAACCRRAGRLIVHDWHHLALQIAEEIADGPPETEGRTRAALRGLRDEAGPSLHSDNPELDLAICGAALPWELWEATESMLGHLRRLNPIGRSTDASLVRDIFGNPFRPVAADPRWLTSTAVSLARPIYADRAFDRLPILADALEDTGCDNPDMLNHLRSDGPHVRGCWAVDLVLGKE